jgi:hypothetical protein
LFQLKWMVQLVNTNVERSIGRYIYTKHYTLLINIYYDLNHWSDCCSAHECFKSTKQVVNQAPNCCKPLLRESKNTTVGTGTVVSFKKKLFDFPSCSQFYSIVLYLFNVHNGEIKM